MTNTAERLHDWTLVQDDEALGFVVERALRAKVVGVDVEANGLFAYRARLCTVQLAWEEDSRTKIAVIDALRVDVTAIAPLLAAPCPIKVLHDLTFDARMLHESGAPLQHVRDTSVIARLLGAKTTGLAAVLSTELGIVLDKRYQQHDWSRRPLEPAQLAYLSNDVAFLLPLERALMTKAATLDIVSEIEAECAYKLVAAVSLAKDPRPAYTRVKGVHRLDPKGRAILRHLVMAREEVAEQLDVPPFKVISNEILLEFARKHPHSTGDLGRIRGALSGRAGRFSARWLEAIAVGIEAGNIPVEDRVFFAGSRLDRQTIALRRRIEGRLNAFRRAEAQRRGVDEQAVLPGHCVHDLAALLGSTTPDEPEIVPRIAAILGIGTKRAEQYAEDLAALLDSDSEEDVEQFEDEPSD